MRIVKEAEERKNEILDAAGRLFGEKGYDATSTNDILKEVGIARGTLYYHFKSKEEILDALIDRMTEQVLAKAKSIAGQRDIPVLQRFTMMMLALNIKGDNFEHKILEQVHKPQNALMHQKIQGKLLHEVTPLIAALIADGIAQGICQTDYPEEAAEMTFLYSYIAFDDLMEYNAEEKNRKIAAFTYNLERLLNMERGSMEKIVRPLFEQS